MKALLVLDMQKGYVKRYDAGLIGRMNRRIECAVQNGDIVVYIKNIRRLESGWEVNELARA